MHIYEVQKRRATKELFMVVRNKDVAEMLDFSQIVSAKLLLLWMASRTEIFSRALHEPTPHKDGGGN